MMISPATAQTSSVLSEFEFNRLQNNEHIEASFSSYGCFHSSTASLVLTSNSILVEDYSMNSETASTAEYQVFDGEFDRLFNYFMFLNKQDKPGGCTTATQITLTKYRNDQAVGSQSFSDDFCIYGNNDVMTLSALIDRAITRAQTPVPLEFD